MKKQENLIPQRQRHWKKYSYLRNKDENIFYQCQCGKKYFSFSALYLHFERKHNQKIKNLHDPTQYHLFTTQKQTHYVFHLKKNFRKSENCSNTKQKLKQFQPPSQLQLLFHNFQKEYKPKMAEGVGKKHLSKFFKHLLQFLFSTVLKQGNDLMDIISKLPIYFNDFILNHTWESQTQIEMRTSCLVLLQFSQWLNWHNYCHLIVELNESQPNQKDIQD